MSVTWHQPHHCNLVRYYHTGSAKKSIFDLEGSTTERGSEIHLRYWSLLQPMAALSLIAELHPRAKRASGRSPIAKEMW